MPQTGAGLAQLLRFLVAASSRDAFPAVRSPWDHFFQDQVQVSLEEAKSV